MSFDTRALSMGVVTPNNAFTDADTLRVEVLEPYPTEGGNMAIGFVDFAITNGALPGTAKLIAGANYRFLFLRDNVVLFKFLAGVSDSALTPITVGELYAAGVTEVDISLSPLLEGANILGLSTLLTDTTLYFKVGAGGTITTGVPSGGGGGGGSTIARAKFQHQETSLYGDATANIWIARPFNTTLYNDITNCVLNGDGSITLPAGTYYVTASAYALYAYSTNHLARVRATSLGVIDYGAPLKQASDSFSSMSRVEAAKVVLASQDAIWIEQYSATDGGFARLGVPGPSGSGAPNIYAEVVIEQLS